MAHFELLPTELQLEVFSLLSIRDVKAARAVSRKCRDNATPALFRSIIACARYQALGVFQKISLHSIFPRYVKEIIFDGSDYDGQLALYDNRYYEAQDKFEDLRVASHWSKRGRWKRYQTLFQEQEDMMASEVLLHTLARGLEWMPNITSIVYSPHPHLIPVERKDMRDLIPRGCSTVPTRSGIVRTSRGYATSHHAFHHLIGAIQLAQYTGIRHFTTEPVRVGIPATEFSLNMFDFPDVKHLQAGQYFFQHLTKIVLNMVLPTFSDLGPAGYLSHAEARKLANLASLLATAKDLCHLSLHLANWQNHSRPSAGLMYGHTFSDERPVFRHLFLQTTWTKLRSLCVEATYADEQDYTQMIARHKDTLSSLVFRMCSLKSGLWADVVDEVVYNSKITSFTLDHVNEAYEPRSLEELESWRYEGRLATAENGDRNFIDTNPEKKSAYTLRS